MAEQKNKRGKLTKYQTEDWQGKKKDLWRMEE
jgi:hypothetical protein